LTPDPIGLDGGINLFIFALNNPVNLIDPYGLQASQWNLANAYPALFGAKPSPPRPMTPAERAAMGVIVDQTLQVTAQALATAYIHPAVGAGLAIFNMLMTLSGVELDPQPLNVSEMEILSNSFENSVSPCP
jgi:hypothetical protein